MGKAHFIAMGGLHGCMPAHCDSYDTLEDAVNSMASMYELGRDRRRALKRDMSLELNLRRDGNEYVEIQECDCNDPEQHNDY